MGTDRLAELGTAREQAAASGVAFEQASALEMGAETPCTMEDEAMKIESFLALCEECSTNTRKIEQLTGELETLHKTALSSASTEESDEASAKIEVVTGRLNQYSNRNRSILKNLELENEQLKEIAPPGSGHMRMRQTKHRALAVVFLKATQKLQKLQQNYRDKYRQQLERQYRIVNPKATSEEIKSVVEGGEMGAQAQIFASAVKGESKKTLAQMKNRFQDVKSIEKSILDLHQLFLDLQTIVVEQGDIINSVEYNVDNALGYTDEAAADMKMAVEYQKSIWRKKWLLVVLVCVGIFILVIVLLWMLGPLLQAGSSINIRSS